MANISRGECFDVRIVHLGGDRDKLFCLLEYRAALAELNAEAEEAGPARRIALLKFSGVRSRPLRPYIAALAGMNTA